MQRIGRRVLQELDRNLPVESKTSAPQITISTCNVLIEKNIPPITPSKWVSCTWCNKSGKNKLGCFANKTPVKLSSAANEFMKNCTEFKRNTGYVGHNHLKSLYAEMKRLGYTRLVATVREPLRTSTESPPESPPDSPSDEKKHTTVPSRSNFCKSTQKRNTVHHTIQQMESVSRPKSTRLMYCSLDDWIRAQLQVPCSFHGKYETCTGRVRLVNPSTNGEAVNIEGHNVQIHLQCEQNPAHMHVVSNYKQDRILGIPSAHGETDKQSSGHFPINVLSVFAHTMAGIDHEAAATSESLMMGHWMESGMFQRIQKKIWTAVKLDFGESKERVQQMIEESKDWSMVADTGWGSRGRTAVHGSLPLIWYEQKMVVLHQVMSKDISKKGKVTNPGNYAGTSIDECFINTVI